MTTLTERMIRALEEHGGVIRPAIKRLMEEAWDEGWQKAHSTDDPAMAGIFFNPYRKSANDS